MTPRSAGSGFRSVLGQAAASFRATARGLGGVPGVQGGGRPGAGGGGVAGQAGGGCDRGGGVRWAHRGAVLDRVQPDRRRTDADRYHPGCRAPGAVGRRPGDRGGRRAGRHQRASEHRAPHPYADHAHHGALGLSLLREPGVPEHARAGHRRGDTQLLHDGLDGVPVHSHRGALRFDGADSERTALARGGGRHRGDRPADAGRRLPRPARGFALYHEMAEDTRLGHYIARC